MNVITIRIESTFLITSSFRRRGRYGGYLNWKGAYVDFIAGRVLCRAEGCSVLVPEVGLEPTCPCERQILSLVRIPISPLRQRISRGKIISPMLQESQLEALPNAGMARHSRDRNLHSIDELPRHLLPTASCSCLPQCLLSCEIRG